MQSEVYRQNDLSIDQRVEDLLARLTLEEKVAQVISIEQHHIEFDEQGNPSEGTREKLQHGVGIVGRPATRRTPSEGARFTNALQRYLSEHTRSGIPALCHEEALHGLMALNATHFPQSIALGSTWDPELVEKLYTAAALEMRTRGSNIALTPDLDLGREPRWGRTEETFSEDPYLVSRMAAAAVRGLQGPDYAIGKQHVAATAKHYAAHGQPEGGRNCAPVNVSRRILIEQFLPPFKAAVEAGVAAVMASYNEIDGVPSHVNSWLLQEMLRKTWGFEGMIISDGNGILQLHEVHRIGATPAESARLAMQAGVNIEISLVNCFALLEEEVRSGRLQESVLDEAVRQVLRLKFRLGLFDDLYVDPRLAEEVNNNPEHQSLALEAARKAIVLLKNEGSLLPLDRGKIKRIAVIGPNAAELHLGGYSYDPGRGVNFLEGIKALAGEGIEVTYAEGCRLNENYRDWRAWWEDDTPLSDPEDDRERIAKAVELARQAEVVILVLGENEATCREAWSENHLGDRDSLDLMGSQQVLVDAVLETGVPVVAVLINGRPLTINTLVREVPAILECWYLGQEGGTAFAEVIFGETNPSGKLPITFPRSVGQLPAYYYHKPSRERSYLGAENGPLFPFGFGLSYTSFAYSQLGLSGRSITAKESLEVTVEVHNTGSRTGEEVVQLYVTDLYASLTRPVKELKGFRRIHLEAGEKQVVGFTIQAKDLAYLGPEMTWVVEPGEFEVRVGPSSMEGLSGRFEVREEGVG